MTLQEIIKSLDELSAEEQASLMNVLRLKLSRISREEQGEAAKNEGETFWQGILSFREAIEKEGIVFTDEDFADLRDRSPGREIEL
ncbi:hypothetical protein IQ241_14570 [Romeria aff. gracilis LEGE 07310]|uniref:Uncharacterized protein n=1 Tax=Vasconcelosia minhoensis LEGE 07310 TaxID=915328 RepID=A0A8J7AFY5_9CYAN|nr:hypothetical protein [Romeria gracilis]MBE9078506.1 hypothetical protein [Romeria aff. gracilis LEGE 07310]